MFLSASKRRKATDGFKLASRTLIGVTYVSSGRSGGPPFPQTKVQWEGRSAEQGHLFP